MATTKLIFPLLIFLLVASIAFAETIPADSKGYYSDSDVVTKVSGMNTNFKDISFKLDTTTVLTPENPKSSWLQDIIDGIYRFIFGTPTPEDNGIVTSEYNLTNMVITSSYVDASKTDQNVKSMGGKSIKQKYSLTDISKDPITTDFIVVTKIQDSSFTWNGSSYDLSKAEKPFVFSAKNDLCGVYNISEDNSTPYATYPCVTGADIQFENSIYDYSDIVDLHHTITVYSEGGSYYIKMNITDITIRPSETIVIDPTYYAMSSGTNFNLKIIASLASTYFGSKIITCDWNNDGKQDLFVAGYNAETHGRTASGSVYGFYSNSTYTSNGTLLDLNASINNFNVRIDGAVPNDQLGLDLACGDWNNDGKKDLAITEYGSDRGKVYVLYSNNSYTGTGNIIDLNTTNNYNVRIDSQLLQYQNFSRSVAIGDWNRDGKDDLIIGSDSNNKGYGSIWILYSNNSYTGTGNIVDLNASLNNFNVRIDGGTSSNVGESVVVGDVNNDGYKDIITNKRGLDVIVIYSNNTITGTGNTYTYTTIQDTYYYHSGGLNPGYNDYVGDVNNDGHKDLIMASEGSSRSAYIVYGNNSWSLLPNYVSDLINQYRYDIKYTSQLSTDQLLSAMTCNFTNSSRNDLFLGGPTNALGLNAGSVFRITNISYIGGGVSAEGGKNDSFNSSLNFTSRYDGITSNGDFGNFIACSDWNNDGKSDLIIGEYLGTPSSRTQAGVIYIINGTSDVESGATNNAPVVNIANITTQRRGAIAFINDYLNITFNVSDADAADSLNVSINWSTNNKTNSSFGCEMGTSPFRNITSNLLYMNSSCGVPINVVVKNQNWTLQVTAWDGTTSAKKNSSIQNISNTNPIINVANITPESGRAGNAYVNAYLNVTFNVSDADTDSMTVLVKWFTNNASNLSFQCNSTNSPFTSLSSNTLYRNASCGIVANNIVTGQSWIAEYNVSDGENVTFKNSSAVIVGNTDPVINTVTIKNNTGYPDTYLNCSFNVTDVDATDSLNITINWTTNNKTNSSYGCDMAYSPFRNITSNALTNNASCGVPAYNTTVYQSWRCQAIVWDGTTSAKKNSTAVNISNGIPIINSIAIAPAAFTTDGLAMNITFNVSDKFLGDNITAQFKWYTNKKYNSSFPCNTTTSLGVLTKNLLYNMSGCDIPINYIVAGQSWIAEINVTDTFEQVFQNSSAIIVAGGYTWNNISSMYETEERMFNITFSGSFTLASVNLIFNGQTIPASLIGTNIYSAYAYGPTNTDSVKQYWEINGIYGGNSYITNSTTNNITILPVNMSTCAGAINDSALNISIYDENAPSVNSGTNATVFAEYYYTNTLSIKNYSAYLGQGKRFRICINENATLLSEFWFRYNNDSGFQTNYYILNTSLSNTTKLYSVYETTTIANYSTLQLTLKNKITNQVFRNAYIQLQRFYMSEGIWRNVQMDKSDYYGNVIFNIIEKDVDYRFLITDDFNNIIYMTDKMNFLCTSGLCAATLLAAPYTSEFPSELLIDISYNNATSEIVTQWLDPTSSTTSLRILVTRETLQGTTEICDNTVTGSSGISPCDVAAYPGGITVNVYSTTNGISNPTITNLFDTELPPLSLLIGEKEGAWWAFGIILTTAAFGLFSPVGAIICAVLGLIMVFFLGLTSVVTVPFIIIAAILGIIVGIKVKT